MRILSFVLGDFVLPEALKASNTNLVARLEGLASRHFAASFVRGMPASIRISNNKSNNNNSNSSSNSNINSN